MLQPRRAPAAAQRARDEERHDRWPARNAHASTNAVAATPTSSTSQCDGVSAANAGCPACSERSSDSCASRTKSAVVETCRAVSPIGSRVRSQAGRTDEQRHERDDRERRLVPAEVPVQPVARTEGPVEKRVRPEGADSRGEEPHRHADSLPLRDHPERARHPHRRSAARRGRARRVRPRAAAVRRPARRRDGDGLAVVLHGGAWKATYNLVHTGHLCMALRRRRHRDVQRRVPPRRRSRRRLARLARGRAARGRATRAGCSASRARRPFGRRTPRAARRRTPATAGRSPSPRCRDPATWANDGGGGVLRRGEPPREASPLAQLPLGVPQVLVHGTRDDVVPFEQSARYAEASGGEAELIPLEGAGHFEPIDPQSPEWRLRRRRCGAVDTPLRFDATVAGRGRADPGYYVTAEGGVTGSSLVGIAHDRRTFLLLLLRFHIDFREARIDCFDCRSRRCGEGTTALGRLAGRRARRLVHLHCPGAGGPRPVADRARDRHRPGDRRDRARLARDHDRHERPRRADRGRRARPGQAAA